MKKLLITTIIAVSSLTTIGAYANQNNAVNNTPHSSMQQQAQYANSGQRGHMGMNKGMNNMMSELNLTAEQKAQIQAFRQNNRGNRMQNRQAMMDILTPEQRQKIAEMQSQHMNNRGSMNDNGHRMNQGDRMMNQGSHMNKSGHMKRNSNRNQ